MRRESSDPSALAQHTPSFDVLHGFVTSNSTSNHFLGTSQRPWMTGAATADAPRVRRPTVNRVTDGAHSHSTMRVQKETEVNTTPGNASSFIFTGSILVSDDFLQQQIQPASLLVAPSTTTSTQLQQENNSTQLNNIATTVPHSAPVVVSETLTQPLPAPTPQVTCEPSLPAPPTTARLSNQQNIPALQTSPQPDWQRWQDAEILRFSAGPQASPTAATAVDHAQPAVPVQTQTPTMMSPISIQAPGTATRKRPSEVSNEGRRTRSRSGGPTASQVPTPIATPTLPPNPYLAQLLEAAAAIRQQAPINIIDEQRLSLLQDACQCNDFVYMVLHQVFCLATLNHNVLVALGFGQAELAGLEVLEPILVNNHRLTPGILSLFANFPGHAISLLGAAIIQLVQGVKNFLAAMGRRWDIFRKTCTTRGYPPSAMELSFAFSLHSPTMQKTLYNSIHRQVSGIENGDFGRRAIDLFLRDQQIFAQNKLALSHDGVFQDGQRFGQMYLQLRLSFGLMPVQHSVDQPHRVSAHSSGNSDSVQISGQVSTQPPATFGPSLPFQQFPVQAGPSGGDLAHAAPAYPQGAVHRRVQQQRSNSGAVTGASLPRFGLDPSMIVNPSPQMLTRPLTATRQHQTRPVRVVHRMQSAASETSLLPPPGYPVLFATNPNPDRVALHQAHLRSPIPRKLDATRREMPDLRLYQYVKDFVLEPQGVHAATKFAEWHFTIDQGAFVQKALDLPSQNHPSSPTVRLYRPGSYLFRLKAISQSSSNTTCPHPSDFNTLAAAWPQCCFVSINDIPDVEFRRRQHHGRDLPADLTHLVRLGHNIIQLSNHSIPEETHKIFFFAVERIHVVDHSEVTAMISNLSATDSLTSITSTLTASQDEEISFADPYVSIDLMDPFMATVWRTPVRGKTCKHRECFDLQAFLLSRTTKVKNGPTSPDQWTCPICKKDARPQQLVIDEFLLQARQELETKGQLDARAILVRQDGTWAPKFEKDKKDPTPLEAPTQTQAGTGQEQAGIDLNGMRSLQFNGEQRDYQGVPEPIVNGTATVTLDRTANMHVPTPAKTITVVEVEDGD